MIKQYSLFENMLNDKYLIGLPSGQIIDIDYREINNIKQEGMIRYNDTLMAYVFKDSEYENVMRYLKRPLPKQKISGDVARGILTFMDAQKNVRSFEAKAEGVIVMGDIFISGSQYERIPFKFLRVSGDFVFRNSQLASLDNAPKEVGGMFIVSGNNLNDLIGGPNYVGHVYDCSDNFLTTLKGAPEFIHSDFNCSKNYLTDLKGSPRKVKGYFDCTNNKIKDTSGGPDCLHIMSDDKKKALDGMIVKTKSKNFNLKDEGGGKYSW